MTGRSLAAVLLLAAGAHPALAHQAAGCPARPAAGAVVTDPEELDSVNGVLRVDLTYRSGPDAAGHERYCYVYRDGTQAPTLRLRPGDELVLRLTNDARPPPPPGKGQTAAPLRMPAMPAGPGACTHGAMSVLATNVHFHGLSVPPTCHQDDVLHTLISPGDGPFVYRVRMPAGQPSGLYWYHPHVHGNTSPQVLGGASGALIIEGIGHTIPALVGMGERVFIIRDMDLMNPDAAPSQSSSVPPPLVMRDAEGEILNTGTGGGKPAKDLSINFVPVPYPAYPPAVIQIRPGEKQLWRVLNAAAITYLDLQVLIQGKPQLLGVVALDGVPLLASGTAPSAVLWQSHILVPPAGRVEFVVKGPPEGASASLVTRTVDTGPAGENDPTRPLARIVAEPDAPEPPRRVSDVALPDPPRRVPLADVKPVRTRLLYFSEQPHDPHDPASRTDFMITVEGQKPRVFDPRSSTPNIVVHQGDVEDWIIENRTRELHAFHIHQIHFMLIQWNGVPLDEPYLRDTINVAYWDGRSRAYPSVRLRMDFREPDIVGTFVYHCHLLEHEDGGMMGTVRVLPAATRSASAAP